MNRLIAVVAAAGALAVAGVSALVHRRAVEYRDEPECAGEPDDEPESAGEPDDERLQWEREDRRERLMIAAVVTVIIVALLGVAAGVYTSYYLEGEAEAEFLDTVASECHVEFPEDIGSFALARFGYTESTTAVDRRGDIVTLTAATVRGDVRVFTGDDASALCVIGMGDQG